MNRLTRRDLDGDPFLTPCDYKEVLERLAAYEDTGLTPEQVKHFFAGYLTADEAKAMYEDEKQRYDEWIAWKQAEAEGRLIVLPCKIGDIVYWNTGLDIRAYLVQGFIIDQESKFRLDLGDIQPVYPWKDHVFLSYEDAEKALNEASKRREAQG